MSREYTPGAHAKHLNRKTLLEGDIPRELFPSTSALPMKEQAVHWYLMWLP